MSILIDFVNFQFKAWQVVMQVDKLIDLACVSKKKKVWAVWNVFLDGARFRWILIFRLTWIPSLYFAFACLIEEIFHKII